MRVTELLKAKGSDVVTIAPQASLRDAVRVLGEYGIGALVVSDDGAHIAGIISERDIVRALAGVGGDALDVQVEQLMTHEVSTCRKDDTLEDVARRMTDGRFRHLPVERDGELHGIISIGDVVKRRLEMLEAEHEQLTTYIQTGR